MGASSSNNSDEENDLTAVRSTDGQQCESTAGTSSAGDPFLEMRHFVLSQAVDAGRLATLTWEEFLKYISGLNQRCKTLVDPHGKYMLFAIKKGTHKSVFWKATVRICCVKVNAANGKVESRKIIGLPQFLRLHATLLSLLSPAADAAQPRAPDQTKEVGERKEGHRAPMAVSAVLDRLESVDSGDSGGAGEDLRSDCAICMERKPDILLPCAHCYCLPCIEQWCIDSAFVDNMWGLRNEGQKCCPVCRSGVSSTSDAWVISDAPDDDELTQYLLHLTDDNPAR